jgi:hypothetical protein
VTNDAPTLYAHDPIVDVAKAPINQAKSRCFQLLSSELFSAIAQV